MSYAPAFTTSYAARQRDPRRHLTGIVLAVIFHVALGYALLNGLAREVVKAIRDPLSVRLIEEIRPSPPPPPPPPPKKIARVQAKPRATPPPAWVPPPEVQVAAPTVEPPITVVQQAAPPEPAPAVAAPAPAPVAAAIGVTCPNHLSIRSSVDYPPQALRLNKSGEVVAEFVVDTKGKIGNVRIAKSSDPIFNKAVTDAVRRFNCVGQGRPVRVTVPFQFALEN